MIIFFAIAVLLSTIHHSFDSAAKKLSLSAALNYHDTAHSPDDKLLSPEAPGNAHIRLDWGMHGTTRNAADQG